MITQEDLKEILHYSSETGFFVWKKVTGRTKVKVGDKAGTLANTGYIRIQIGKKKYQAHRLAWLYMTGSFPKNQIDHDDRDKTNNAFYNLNEATNQENQRNMPKSKRNTSDIVGVWFRKDTNKWGSKIIVNYDSVSLGCFTDKFEAICARKSAENKFNFHENHGN